MLTVFEFVDQSNFWLLEEYDYLGRNCVHLIVQYIHTRSIQETKEMLAILCSLEIDINRKNRSTGDHILHVLVRKQAYEITDWLIERTYMDLDGVNKKGETPYHIAFKNEDFVMMQLLYKFGAKCEEPIIKQLNNSEASDSDD